MTIDWQNLVNEGVCNQDEAALLSQHIERSEDGAWTFSNMQAVNALWWVVERVVLHLCPPS